MRWQGEKKSFDRYIRISKKQNNSVFRFRKGWRVVIFSLTVISFTAQTLYYVVTAGEDTLGDDENLQLGKHQWNINGLTRGSDYILWIKDGLISCLEGFSYNEPWPDEILWCEKIESLR